MSETTQMQDFLTRQAKVCRDNCEIEKDLYKELGVKRGLRDVNGVGVLAGLTNISCIQSSEMINGEKVPCEGKLFYRGYNSDLKKSPIFYYLENCRMKNN